MGPDSTADGEWEVEIEPAAWRIGLHLGSIPAVATIFIVGSSVGPLGLLVVALVWGAASALVATIARRRLSAVFSPGRLVCHGWTSSRTYLPADGPLMERPARFNWQLHLVMLEHPDGTRHAPWALREQAASLGPRRRHRYAALVTAARRAGFTYVGDPWGPGGNPAGPIIPTDTPRRY